VRTTTTAASVSARYIVITLRYQGRCTTQFNPTRQSQSNVAHHYDLSGARYDLFLGEDQNTPAPLFRAQNDARVCQEGTNHTQAVAGRDAGQE
jgi:cyclopropane fatty-acyl-phospholipid synthase-like methyltransferase